MKIKFTTDNESPWISVYCVTIKPNNDLKLKCKTLYGMEV